MLRSWLIRPADIKELGVSQVFGSLLVCPGMGGVYCQAPHRIDAARRHNRNMRSVICEMRHSSDNLVAFLGASRML